MSGGGKEPNQKTEGMSKQDEKLIFFSNSTLSETVNFFFSSFLGTLPFSSVDKRLKITSPKIL